MNYMYTMGPPQLNVQINVHSTGTMSPTPEDAMGGVLCVKLMLW